jgi:hypothetical protein
MENKMAEKKFCKNGNAYVIANPYNRYEENPEKCLYKNDRTKTACDRCVMYINSAKTR